MFARARLDFAQTQRRNATRRGGCLHPPEHGQVLHKPNGKSQLVGVADSATRRSLMKFCGTLRSASPTNRRGGCPRTDGDVRPYARTKFRNSAAGASSRPTDWQPVELHQILTGGRGFSPKTGTLLSRVARHFPCQGNTPTPTRQADYNYNSNRKVTISYGLKVSFTLLPFDSSGVSAFSNKSHTDTRLKSKPVVIVASAR